MTTHKRMHDVPVGTSLKLIRDKRTAWSWCLKAEEEVELIEIQEQPVKFKVKDKLGRTWMLDSHDVELPSEKGQQETAVEAES